MRTTASLVAVVVTLAGCRMSGPIPRNRRVSAAAAGADQEARWVAIRANPRAPEPGGTPAEARAICAAQTGEFVEHGDAGLACRVGGRAVFFGVLEHDRLVRVETFYEGADIATARDGIAEKLGPPQSESVSTEGFRVFRWVDGNVEVSMYERGVRFVVTK